MQRKRNPSQPDRDEFYDNPRWKRIRQSALRRDGYMDREAKRFGKIKQAEVVHHIFPKDEFPEYAFSVWNLISLSRQTHNEMHDRDTDELTEKGRDLLLRTARRNNIPVPEKYEKAKQSQKGKGVRIKRDRYYDYH